MGMDDSIVLPLMRNSIPGELMDRNNYKDHKSKTHIETSDINHHQSVSVQVLWCCILFYINKLGRHHIHMKSENIMNMKTSN